MTTLTLKGTDYGNTKATADNRTDSECRQTKQTASCNTEFINGLNALRKDAALIQQRVMEKM